MRWIWGCAWSCTFRSPSFAIQITWVECDWALELQVSRRWTSIGWESGVSMCHSMPFVSICFAGCGKERTIGVNPCPHPAASRWDVIRLCCQFSMPESLTMWPGHFLASPKWPSLCRSSVFSQCSHVTNLQVRGCGLHAKPSSISGLWLWTPANFNLGAPSDSQSVFSN